MTNVVALDELETIDWTGLVHAYGSAGDVPDLIRALVSPNAAARDSAFEELFHNIYHQGTIYEATTYTVPFLIAILNSPYTPDRAMVAGLLACIASGRGYFEVHAAIGGWREILEKQGTTLEAELERERVVTASVRHAAQAALPLLIPFLADKDPGLRACIAEALAAYPEHQMTHLPLLRSALATETDESVRECIADCIGQLTSGSEGWPSSSQ